MRIAAIDIGSNSIRLMIVDVPVGGRRVTLDEEKVYARLGHGVHETGLLSTEAMDAAVTALDRDGPARPRALGDPHPCGRDCGRA